MDRSCKVWATSAAGRFVLATMDEAGSFSVTGPFYVGELNWRRTIACTMFASIRYGRGCELPLGLT